MATMKDIIEGIDNLERASLLAPGEMPPSLAARIDELFRTTRELLSGERDLEQQLIKLGIDKYRTLRIKDEHFPSYITGLDRSPAFIDPEIHIMIMASEMIFEAYMESNDFHNLDFIFKGKYTYYSGHYNLGLGTVLYKGFVAAKGSNPFLGISAKDIWNFFKRKIPTKDFAGQLARIYIEKAIKDLLPYFKSDSNVISFNKVEYGNWSPLNDKFLRKNEKITLHFRFDMLDTIKSLELLMGIVFDSIHPADHVPTPCFDALDKINKYESERFEIEIPSNYGWQYKLPVNYSNRIRSIVVTKSGKHTMTIDGIKYESDGQQIIMSFYKEYDAKRVVDLLLKPELDTNLLVEFFKD